MPLLRSHDASIKHPPRLHLHAPGLATLRSSQVAVVHLGSHWHNAVPWRLLTPSWPPTRCCPPAHGNVHTASLLCGRQRRLRAQPQTCLCPVPSPHPLLCRTPRCWRPAPGLRISFRCHQSHHRSLAQGVRRKGKMKEPFSFPLWRGTKSMLCPGPLTSLPVVLCAPWLSAAAAST